jgi:hypothetical protein
MSKGPSYTNFRFRQNDDGQFVFRYLLVDMPSMFLPSAFQTQSDSASARFKRLEPCTSICGTTTWSSGERTCYALGIIIYLFVMIYLIASNDIEYGRVWYRTVDVPLHEERKRSQHKKLIYSPKSFCTRLSMESFDGSSYCIYLTHCRKHTEKRPKCNAP